MKASHQEVLVANEIGYYYSHKNSQKTASLDMIIASTKSEIQALGLMSIKVDAGVVTIELKHLGLFIGSHGSNIEAVTKWLKERLDFVKKLHIREVREIEGLYDFTYLDMGDDF